MFPLPALPVPRRPTLNRDLATWLALVLALSAVACDEEKAPTAPPNLEAQAVAISPGAADDITTQGTIPLPVNQTFNGTALAFGITQTGTGATGLFRINNAGNRANALLGQTNGSGIAVRGLATSATSRAGSFEITNSNSNQDVLLARGNGRGNTISAVNTGLGRAGMFVKTSTTSAISTLFAQTPGISTAVEAQQTGRGSAGLFSNTNANNPNPALLVQTAGVGIGGHFLLNNQSNAQSAVFAFTTGTGWAGEFHGQSKGVQISTSSGVGLQVTGGTKQAVVGTLTGARSLYSEEATEVWFTDYGFGKLASGRARVLIDPSFAQTVSLDEPYHVFVQPYGRAELYVEERSDLGFVVMVKDGDPNVEFGYRVVAKRQGFETQRLERAPWADNSVGF
jgi:hypothetical protein